MRPIMSNISTIKPFVTIEAAKPFDIDKILIIQKENNLGYWQWKDYFDEIYKEKSVFLVAKSGQSIKGFVLARLITFSTNGHIQIKEANNKSESEFEIYNLGVDSNCRRKGIGTHLLQKIIQIGIEKKVNSIWLEVRSLNSGAISLYKKNGFTEIYRRKNFYKLPTEDALVMKLELRS